MENESKIEMRIRGKIIWKALSGRIESCGFRHLTFQLWAWAERGASREKPPDAITHAD